MVILNEKSVRSLRDRVFGVLISDEIWDAIKHNWMQPETVEWLREHAEVRIPLTERP